MKATSCHQSKTPTTPSSVTKKWQYRNQGHFVPDKTRQGPIIVADTKASQSGNLPLRLIQSHYPHPPTHPVHFCLCLQTLLNGRKLCAPKCSVQCALQCAMKCAVKCPQRLNPWWWWWSWFRFRWQGADEGQTKTYDFLAFLVFTTSPTASPPPSSWLHLIFTSITFNFMISSPPSLAATALSKGDESTHRENIPSKSSSSFQKIRPWTSLNIQ